MSLNPFSFGSPVTPAQLFGRRRELRRVVGRLQNRGQSSALVGEPRAGKTSLLHYLMDATQQEALYGPAQVKLFFCYLDALTLGAEFSPAQFWALALEPLQTATTLGPTAPLPDLLRACRLAHYEHRTLEALFEGLQGMGWGLVLLLDEFDALVARSDLQHTAFYGGLRALASRYAALALVVAARQTVGQLNRLTQTLSGHASPFFNIMEEVALGPLTARECGELLDQAKHPRTKAGVFSVDDRRYLLRLTGGHPYLLQVAAAALWEAYAENLAPPAKRWQSAGHALYTQAEPTLADTWRLWPAEMKKAFVMVALDQLPTLLGEKQFDLAALLNELPAYAPELRALKLRGFVQEKTGPGSGWTVTAEVMLWWLADELAKAVRQQDALGVWLNAQGWEGLWKTGEKKQLIVAMVKVGGLLKGGVDTFIAAAGEELGKRLSGGK